ncbi:hypothetical protein PENFLA_c035G05839 [Penicillium flavigenum]|uniref:Retrovirus-related Pol polyprotein from transposon TNT 1-94-like beta-barrel domain-containing protein n=1 Tax=Penicillium flavigenum TaxID=254877 RepID=A0A1V6SLB1_9EURO|nr:hypothetical protein PENFLA_c035G05839 [Penicillium flavigenum]
MPDPHPEKKKAYDKAMKEDPNWKAFQPAPRSSSASQQANQRASQPESKPTREQANQRASQPESKPTREQANQRASQPESKPASKTLQAGELGFFLVETPLASEAFSIRETEKNRPDQEYSVTDRELSAIDHEHSVIDHDHSMFHHIRYDSIRDRWLIDTGAQVHICINRSLFIEFQEAESSIRVGDTETIVGGIGTVLIYGVSPRENETPKQMMLFNVRYSPGFHTNIISHGLMFSNTKAFLNFEKNWIQQDGIPLYAVYQDQNLPWLVQLGSMPLANAAVKKSAREPAAEASIENWHRRLGHVSKERIEKLTEITEGLQIAGGNPAENQFVALIRNWLNVKIRVFHYDNERSAGNEVENMIEAEGCVIEHSPPKTPEMNGPAQRSGGVII